MSINISLTGVNKKFNNKTLHQIVDDHDGSIGGFVESMDSLGENAWVDKNSILLGDSFIENVRLINSVVENSELKESVVMDSHVVDSTLNEAPCLNSNITKSNLEYGRFNNVHIDHSSVVRDELANCRVENDTLIRDAIAPRYELLDEHIYALGYKAHRIRALEDFGDVKAGDLGGFVESYETLQHVDELDTSWVYDDSIVTNSVMSNNSSVKGYSTVRASSLNRADISNARYVSEASISGTRGLDNVNQCDFMVSQLSFDSGDYFDVLDKDEGTIDRIYSGTQGASQSFAKSLLDLEDDSYQL